MIVSNKDRTIVEGSWIIKSFTLINASKTRLSNKTKTYSNMSSRPIANSYVILTTNLISSMKMSTEDITLQE